MFDTHTHIFDQQILENLDFILQNAKKQNFKGILCICENEEEIELFSKYSKIYDFLFLSVGIHPHNSKSFDQEIFIKMFNKAKKTSKLVAIGETGLDFYYNFSNEEKQILSFLFHIDIAKKNSLPLIIHARNSYQQIYNFIREYRIENAVIHCFNENYFFAKKITDMGLFLGFTGILTFKNNNLIETVKKIPIDKILIETDSPYLSPHPKRGGTNTPLNLKYILEKIAEIKNLEKDFLENILDNNAINFFKINL